nr:hypothetical protein [uncultured Fusobacterium sp.]
MKKLFFSFMFLFSIYTFGGIFGGGGGSSSTAVLLKILAVETASKSEHIKNTIEAIQQTQHLKNQLEHDIQNALQFAEGIKNGNEYAIQKLIHSAFNYQETAQSIMYEQSDMLDKLQQIYKPIEGLEGLTVENLRDEIANIRKQQQFAVYDSMRNAGFSATLKQDQQNLQKLINSTNSTQGQLQALQAIGNLLAEQNAILLKMGTLMETQTKMITMSEGANNSIEQANTQSINEVERNAQRETEKVINDIKSNKKKIKL